MGYIPLMTQRQPLGTFQIASRHQNQHSDVDIGCLIHVAEQLTLALNNVLAYEEIKSLKDQLTAQKESLPSC